MFFEKQFANSLEILCWARVHIPSYEHPNAFFVRFGHGLTVEAGLLEAGPRKGEIVNEAPSATAG